ncbi:hypothetical protein C8Q78DRAFT_820571 [Trametes maxima]|nr:hypothetical protein C8Q78DRAFT_820571 [Trametes maxima]
MHLPLNNELEPGLAGTHANSVALPPFRATLPFSRPFLTSHRAAISARVLSPRPSRRAVLPGRLLPLRPEVSGLTQRHIAAGNRISDIAPLHHHYPAFISPRLAYRSGVFRAVWPRSGHLPQRAARDWLFDEIEESSSSISFALSRPPAGDR